jgi:hypothetical protein
MRLGERLGGPQAEAYTTKVVTKVTTTGCGAYVVMRIAMPSEQHMLAALSLALAGGKPFRAQGLRAGLGFDRFPIILLAGVSVLGPYPAEAGPKTGSRRRQPAPPPAAPPARCTAGHSVPAGGTPPQPNPGPCIMQRPPNADSFAPVGACARCQRSDEQSMLPRPAWSRSAPWEAHHHSHPLALPT